MRKFGIWGIVFILLYLIDIAAVVSLSLLSAASL